MSLKRSNIEAEGSKGTRFTTHEGTSVPGREDSICKDSEAGQSLI